MSSDKKIKQLIDTDKTVFSASDLRGIWGIEQDWFKTVVKRMVDQGVLTRLSRGYYSLKNDFDPYELANTTVTPSYVSFNSALRYFDISFQTQKTISSAASLTHTKKIAGYTFEYHKLKEELLFNLEGIKSKQNVTVAVPERAILDSFYLSFLPNLDREDKINVTRLKKLMKFYPKETQKKTKKLIKKI